MKGEMKHAISIIVLVITILVLSILAAAVIISISNSNIMEKASQTVFKSDMANFKEAYEMYVIGEFADNVNYDKSTLNVTYASNKKVFEDIFGANVSEKYKAGLQIVNGKLVYETENETEQAVLKDLGMVASQTSVQTSVPIPVGFYYVGGDKATGLVISDEQADANQGVNADLVGNQFVWVPVEDEDLDWFTVGKGTESGLKEWYTMGFWAEQNVTAEQAETIVFTDNYNGYDGEQDEFAAMCASVQEYGGFYIARYEAGNDDGGSNISLYAALAPENYNVVSKQGAAVYNCVPWVDSEEGQKGAVTLSKEMATNNGYTSVVSTLCYGVQWDAAMKFVKGAGYDVERNSSSWGNTSDSQIEGAGEVLPTGYNEAWSSCNIYDLAGNVAEWTMEAGYSTSSEGISRVIRGGGYVGSGAVYPAAVRYLDVAPTVTFAYLGFRPALYIKLGQTVTWISQD